MKTAFFYRFLLLKLKLYVFKDGNQTVQISSSMAATGALVSGTAPIVSVYTDKSATAAAPAQHGNMTQGVAILNRGLNTSTLQPSKPIVSNPAIIGK